jgi:hypothetical protein
VIKPDKARSALDKLLAFDYTDAEAVYAIDGDCLALKKLDAVFAHCHGLDFAVQGGWQQSGRWHDASVEQLLEDKPYDRLPKFNGGALYYQRGTQFTSLLSKMQQVEAQYADSGFGAFRGKASEEVCVALAMMETGIGSVIPEELDFMNTGSGLVGRLRLDVRRGECGFLQRKAKMRYVEPFVFHASEYSNFAVYWKQLRWLAQMEEFEDTHRPGYRSRGFKLRRSLERRWLALTERRFR